MQFHQKSCPAVQYELTAQNSAETAPGCVANPDAAALQAGNLKAIIVKTTIEQTTTPNTGPAANSKEQTDIKSILPCPESPLADAFASSPSSLFGLSTAEVDEGQHKGKSTSSKAPTSPPSTADNKTETDATEYDEGNESAGMNMNGGASSQSPFSTSTRFTHQTDNETEEEDGSGELKESSVETGLPPFTDEDRELFGLVYE